jgi:photosynthetic reaction center H subunit
MIIGLSDHIDLALVVLYLFWIFFFGPVFYLNRESTREGFPAVSEATGRPMTDSILGLPEPKRFRLRDAEDTFAPHPEDYTDPEHAREVAGFGGAPLAPTGDPMKAEFGPGAWAPRADRVLMTYHGEPKISPLRAMPEFEVVKADRDPRGLPVVAGDGKVVGEVSDVWIDREEQLIRYLEVEGGALVPMTLARVGGRLAKFGVWKPEVKVKSLMADQFAGIPGRKDADTVTLLEEDKITAYFGAGTFYATQERSDPLI